VQPDLVRELGPGKGLDLQHIVQELDQLIDMAADVADLVGLRHRVQMAAQVVHAAAGRHDDMVEAGEVPDEQRLGPGRVGIAAAIAHGLAAAGLVHRVGDLDPEPLQELQAGDADLREEGVDETGDSQADFHDGEDPDPAYATE
jgi:hypothetical protein